MPTNLPPQYFEAEKVFRQAKTPREKIEALENMLAIMPKHKGTDHLRGELRARIAKLTDEAEQQRKAGAAGRTQLYHVPREGAGQVALVGPPNTGKSQLVATLTGANPKVGPYPFTTQLPQAAMMPFENVQVQLVDLPPVTEEGTPGWMRQPLRHADLLMLVVSLAEDPLSEMEGLERELATMHIEVAPEAGEPDPESITIRKGAVLVANKLDEPDSRSNLELLELDLAGRLPLLAVSAVTGEGLEALRHTVYGHLGVIRVYTRPPGKEPNMAEPTVLKRGGTVDDLAALIHKDIREKFRYAVLWGSGRFSGQRVGRQYVLEDGDIVELIA